MRKHRIVIRVTIKQDCTCMKSNQQLDVFSYREGLIINECIRVFILSDSTCLIHMLCDMLTTWEVQVRRSLKTEFFLQLAMSCLVCIYVRGTKHACVTSWTNSHTATLSQMVLTHVYTVTYKLKRTGTKLNNNKQ